MSPYVAHLSEPHEENNVPDTTPPQPAPEPAPVPEPVPGTEHGAYADTRKVSPKVIASAVAAFVAPAILLGLLFLQTDEGQVYFGGLPKILVVIIGGLIASGVTFVSGYIKRDPARNG